VRAQRIELGLGGTDLFPRIVPWVNFGPSLGRLGWVKGPGVSRPSSRFGGADNKGDPAAGSDGAHLLVCLRFGRHKTHRRRRRLPPSPGGHGFAVFNRHMHVVVGTWSGIAPGRLIVGEN
jgi:hypothetical protein